MSRRESNVGETKVKKTKRIWFEENMMRDSKKKILDMKTEGKLTNYVEHLRQTTCRERTSQVVDGIGSSVH